LWDEGQLGLFERLLVQSEGLLRHVEGLLMQLKGRLW